MQLTVILSFVCRQIFRTSWINNFHYTAAYQLFEHVHCTIILVRSCNRDGGLCTTCYVSCVTFHVSHVTFFFFFSFWTKWQSSSLESRLSMEPTPFSFKGRPKYTKEGKAFERIQMLQMYKN